MKNWGFLIGALVCFLGSSCSITQVAKKSARQNLLQKSQMKGSEVGIAIYNPHKDKYVYEHQADKYYTPASNTKLFSLYTGLALLGDSTTGIQYQIIKDTMYIRGTGDPSFLHPDFSRQRVFTFLNKVDMPIVMVNPVNENAVYGPGWNPLYYNAAWQPERSSFPIYGNVVRFSLKGKAIHVLPSFFSSKERLISDKSLRVNTFSVRREIDKNIFHYHIYKNSKRTIAVPFMTDKGKTTALLLADTLHKPILYEPYPMHLSEGKWKQVYNIPLDSLFKRMMHRSDNFFAEQVLQMSSMELLGKINTLNTIQYIQEESFANRNVNPHWVDGSGLSSLNRFSPKDFIAVLKLLYADYPKKRINNILPTGGEGTLSSLYQKMQQQIFAKTGTLGSGVVTLSGYFETKKGKLLYFSILLNDSKVPAKEARQSIEQFIYNIWDKG